MTLSVQAERRRTMKIDGVEIGGITCDSREVKKGYAFVAVKGSRRDGSSFAGEALKRGASLIISEKGAGGGSVFGKARRVVVKDARKFLAEASAEFYGRPSEKMKVAGVTGTNGKTTVTYLIEAIAKRSGEDCGVIGTVNYRFSGKELRAKNTTPGPVELQRLLAGMLRRRIKYCAMEVSSHALVQQRVRGISFSQAIFTNLTQDHLDYHKSLNNYFSAKARLFRLLRDTGTAIVNNDDKYGRRIKKLLSRRPVTYGIKNRSTVMARDICFGAKGSKFTLVAPGIESSIRTPMIGLYNIYNILAAVCWGISEKISFNHIKSAIEEFKCVPGRLERAGDNIFIDYAHTPDALSNVIKALRPLIAGRIIVVFGCGGERDRSKRPKMGRIATELADYAVITTDNPRSEDPLRITAEICRGARRGNYCVLVDRFEAIRKAVSLKGRNDCLVIAGKGHEDYQALKEKVVHFSDREAVRKCLR
ncbi:MAG: UDP-N-acetylmuramoyl-L-alanyl-D-glutamate--2,6-diaminopimelate ligase [Candidatus Omnitrophica bacterium]|nr:UDP-N-acetylmuramoyl-L-alanyl-D-glutamate--2,6-diaminopimelate ligase [Candidatus Omnitrophota bacterium]MDD5770970.1 UDP-N-acetylmuramoyl-L-alanyl-D-glutamate--2,6-diaminopimelate ligase [Candidatus Omnitrophota bacterium]